MRVGTIFALFAVIVSISTATNAAIVQIDNSGPYPRAYGILGLDVDGEILDVTFRSGLTYNELFASSSPYFLGDETGATAASLAIAEALNTALDPSPPVPSLNSGAALTPTAETDYVIPFFADATTFQLKGGRTNDPIGFAYVQGNFWSETQLRDQFPAGANPALQHFATFAQPVPEPSAIAIWLLLSTFGLVAFKRRRS